MSKLGDEPAYPVLTNGKRYFGLSKREKIAALQMQALIICGSSIHRDKIIERALDLTDALLERMKNDH